MCARARACVKLLKEFLRAVLHTGLFCEMRKETLH